jgi:hypothetical protein
MRVTRPFSLAAVGLVVVVGLAACGSSGGTKGQSTSQLSHGMSGQEMKCMSKQYAAAHSKACPEASHDASHDSGPAYTLAKPLSFTADGLVDPNSVDLSGVKGVSPEQQQEAEQLLLSTVKTLPKWSDYNQAVADGFQSIGDGLTGEEHLLHWDWIDDATMFDPSHPESLVYKVDRAAGTKTLEAAMFILPKQYTLDNPPPINSPLVQFHRHDNLCFTPPPAPQVRGLTDSQGNCRAPLVKFNPNIQAHVWIRKNDCGPFAALLGVGAGQIEAGAERSCVHDPNRVGL